MTIAASATGVDSSCSSFTESVTISTAANELYSHMQLFQNGSVESMMRTQWDVGGLAWVSGMEKALVDEHHSALKTAFLKLGIDDPAVLMRSFTVIGSVSLEGAGVPACHHTPE